VTPVRIVSVRFLDGVVDGRGLLGADPRVRALCRTLVALPGVRHVLPDRVSVDGDTEAVVERLRGERWLVESVRLE
jgi:hypothetical protein